MVRDLRRRRGHRARRDRGQGLNLGIDFKGGTQIAFETPQPVSLDEVRAQAARIGEASAQIQGRGTATGGDAYRNCTVTPSR